VKNAYRLFRRADRGGTFYCEDVKTKRQESLRTTSKVEADGLLRAKNEAARIPAFSLSLARTYLVAHDPKMVSRTWQQVMEEMATHGIQSTQDRCKRAFNSRAYDPIRKKPIVQTTAEDLLQILHANGNSVGHYLRRLHNLAVDLGWLAWPILAKRVWPKIRSATRRAITQDEHELIICSEQNTERRAYYEFLYETGAAQTDAANMAAENIDWAAGVLIYHRQKLGPERQPARLMIGSELRRILESLPSSGPLFPKIKASSAAKRSAEFRRRRIVAGVRGVSLHSYRHAWTERAKRCGYPERFAQEALGHSSRAVHAAYARRAEVLCPPLDEFERAAATKIIAMPQAHMNSMPHLRDSTNASARSS
jgi:integrase